MDNPSFIYDSFHFAIEEEDKLIQKKLVEAYHNKNIDKFKNLLKRISTKTRSLEASESAKFFFSFDLFRIFSFNLHPKIEISSVLNEQNKARKLVFERESEFELNLFEKILKTPGDGNAEFLSLVWVECELWRDENVLMKPNPQGKFPIDFIIESNDDDNLFSFLIYNLEARMAHSANTDHHYFLKLKNDHFIIRSGKSIFHKIYSIVNHANLKKCVVVIEEMLKEIKIIQDIKVDVEIDLVLELPDMEIKEKILKMFVKFWKIESKDYVYYRKILVDISPFYKLFLNLKENNEEEFEDTFPEYLNYMKIKHSENFNRDLQNDSNFLLTFALNNGQKRAMKLLISCYAVDVNKILINSLDNSSINNEYAMLKLLEKGYYIGYEDDKKVSKDGNFISSKVLETFLDSCVTTGSFDRKHSGNDQYDRGIQIDYTFLISPEIRPIAMKNSQDDNGILLFNAGMRPLELILDNEKLRHLITHPVLSTFINLKSFKFSQFYNLNLYMFVCFYVLPFLLVFVYYEPHETGWTLFPATISTVYLTVREAIQFFWITDNKIEYFKKKSNKLELLMIVSSWWLLLSLFMQSYHQYQISLAFIILFATIELLAILPYSSLSIYMFMLKTVSITFLKFFTIFILIILAFTFSFYAILKPIKHISKYSKFRNDTSNHETVFKNFEHPFTSFIKTILMFAGDFSIDPYKLDSIWKQILFLCFVLTAFILYNLINGLAISDIQKLKDDAEFLNLKQRIRTTVDCENILCNLYWKLSGIKKLNEISMENTKDLDKPREEIPQNQNCWSQTTRKLLKFMVNRYPFLHKMDNLWVDIKHKSVTYKINHKQEPILRRHNGIVKNYCLDDENFERLISIIKEKDNNDDECMANKIQSIQNDVTLLKDQMGVEFEELKKLIHEFAEKNVKNVE